MWQKSYQIYITRVGGEKTTQLDKSIAVPRFTVVHNPYIGFAGSAHHDNNNRRNNAEKSTTAGATATTTDTITTALLIFLFNRAIFSKFLQVRSGLTK